LRAGELFLAIHLFKILGDLNYGEGGILRDTLYLKSPHNKRSLWNPLRSPWEPSLAKPAMRVSANEG